MPKAKKTPLKPAKKKLPEIEVRQVHYVSQHQVANVITEILKREKSEVKISWRDFHELKESLVEIIYDYYCDGRSDNYVSALVGMFREELEFWEEGGTLDGAQKIVALAKKAIPVMIQKLEELPKNTILLDDD
jgi:hypothetical protein